MRMRTAAVVATLAALAATLHPGMSARGQQKPLPTFRSAVTLVPVDVGWWRTRPARPSRTCGRRSSPSSRTASNRKSGTSLQTFATEATDPGTKLSSGRGDLVRAPDQPDLPGRPRPRQADRTLEGHGRAAALRTTSGCCQPTRWRSSPTTAPRPSRRTTSRSRASSSGSRRTTNRSTSRSSLQMSGLAALYGAKLIPKSLQGRSTRCSKGRACWRRSESIRRGGRQAGREGRCQVGRSTTRSDEQIEVDEGRSAAAAAGIVQVSAWSEIDEIQTQMFCRPVARGLRLGHGRRRCQDLGTSTPASTT